VERVVNGDFRVGPWLVAPSLNSISCKGTTVRLEPKVMAVLVCLAEHAGETLPKETLFHTVWPDTFVTDDVLTHSISELRRAFEDDAREPHIIQTIPKRGYRLVAPVSSAVVAAAASTTRDSIAVLPFVNMSADTENEYFTDGITEEIINALAQIKDLHVVARSSAFSFKGKHIDPRVVGEQLNVRRVLEGSVRRADNRLRITVQLINVADGYHLWSERYDREMKDVFEIQEEIARSIAERLKLTLEGDQAERLVKAGTRSLEAYQLYLKGRALLYRRGGAIPQAAECLDRAVKLDPDYALAWAGLADTYTTLGYYGLAPPKACMPKGMEAARRAVALGPSLAEAHAALAIACLMGVWDKAEAELEFLRALELNPKYIQARDWYAFFYLQFAADHLEEGVAQAKLAVEADPLSSYAHTILGFTYTFARRYADGVRECQRGVELDSASYLARGCLLVALHFSGRFDDAVAAGESALAISGRHPWTMALLAVTLADWGKPADAEAIYAEMMARARRGYMQPCTLALAAAAAGFKDDALRHAREAFEIRDPMSQMFFSRNWPDSARLRADLRFYEIAADMGWLLK
jgi:adenylate cyclase